MPQVTVYIRDDDLKKWKTLKKKSEFIHSALNRTNKGIPLEVIGTAAAKKGPNYNPPTTLPKLCKHGSDPKFCKFAKNGKPCK